MVVSAPRSTLPHLAVRLGRKTSPSSRSSGISPRSPCWRRLRSVSSVPLKLAGDGSRLIHFPAEVAHHIGAGKAEHAMPQPKAALAASTNPPRRTRCSVAPLGLISSPVHNWLGTARRCFRAAGSNARRIRSAVRPSLSPIAGSSASALPGSPRSKTKQLPCCRYFKPTWSICRASHSRPFIPTWILNGNHVCSRAYIQPTCGSIW